MTTRTGQGTEAFARQQMGLLAHALGAEQCRQCARYEGDGFCAAFPYPSGIPEAILAGEHDHTQSYPGDGGLGFMPLDLDTDEIALCQEAMARQQAGE